MKTDDDEKEIVIACYGCKALVTRKQINASREREGYFVCQCGEHTLYKFLPVRTKL